MYRYLLFYFLFCAINNGPTTASVIPCLTNLDCEAPSSSCQKFRCECPLGKTLSYDGTECLQYTVAYNTECLEDVQCALLLGRHHCVSGHCRCQNGWKFVQGRCVRRAEIGAKCNTDLECFNGLDMLASSCKSGVCACNEGYYARGKFDCRQISTNVNDYCALDSDCQFDRGACAYGQCVTKSYDWPNDRMKYYKKFEDTPTIVASPVVNEYSTTKQVLNEDCTNDTDCTSIKNSHCHLLVRKCVCNRGFFESEDKCKAELGVKNSCVFDWDCVANAKCDGLTCKCNNGHVYGDGNRECRKSTTSPDFPCSTDESCALFGENYYCVFDMQIFSKRCICSMGFELDKEHSLCMVNALECNSNFICTETMPNSECLNFKCVCQEHHREVEDRKCVPLIGGTCAVDTDCSSSVENTVCDSQNKCKCLDGMIPLDEDTCIKVVDGLMDQCVIDEQCSAKVMDSVCLNGKCKCSDSFLEYQGACIREKIYESYCESSTSCRTTLSRDFLCRNSKCKCPSDMAVTDDLMHCERGSGVMIRSGITMMVMVMLAFIVKLL